LIRHRLPALSLPKGTDNLRVMRTYKNTRPVDSVNLGSYLVISTSFPSLSREEPATAHSTGTDLACVSFVAET